jgi:hypothetical protein
MPDFDAFESALAAALRSDADRRVAAVDPAVVARAAIARRRPVRFAWHPSRWLDARWSGIGRRTLILAILVLIAMAVGGAILVGTRLRTEAPIGILPRNGEIAVVSQTAGLIAVDPASKAVRSVEGCIGECVRGDAPSWSPDGTKLAYSAEGTIWITDVATGLATRLTTCCDAPGGGGGWPHPSVGWSPDGTRIVFAKAGHLFTIDLPNGNPTPLAAELAPLASQATWSPDGSRIAFTWQGDPPGIYTIRIDGTDMRAVATSRVDPPTSPAWSPDGSRIAYLEDPASDQTFTARLLTIRADGTDPRLVFDVPGCCVADLGDVRWSPDGTKIATILGPVTYRLYVVDVEGGRSDQLIDGVRPGAIGWRPLP